MKASTVLNHSCLFFSSRFISEKLPAARKADFSTSVAHSSLGLLLFRTYWSVQGAKEFGQKIALRNKLSLGSLATLPYNINCCFSSVLDSGLCSAVFRTSRFRILEIQDGLMPKILRKQPFWKPSGLLRSAVFNNVVPNPCNNFDSTRALKASTFRIFVTFICFQN